MEFTEHRLPLSPNIQKAVQRYRLHEYGIHTEKSDYRVHVCWDEGFTYLFETPPARQIVLEGRYQFRFAGQDYVHDGPTSLGMIVPWNAIPGIERIAIPSDLNIFCEKNDDTEVKGDKAYNVAVAMVQRKLFRFPAQIKEMDPAIREMLEKVGADMFVYFGYAVQIKSDKPGGKDVSGNLYLQTHERNPRKLHGNTGGQKLDLRRIEGKPFSPVEVLKRKSEHPKNLKQGELF